MNKSKSHPAMGIGYLDRIAHFLLILTLFSFVSAPAQDKDYWANAPSGKIKIFTVSFIDDQNGIAKSAEGDVFVTADGGISWAAKNEITDDNENNTEPLMWNADIYCSIMKTTDGGNTWFPYEEGKQEHFCGVYLKDANTGYRVASDFLNKVTNEIIIYSENNKLDSLIDHPHQCTEYYKSADEGWALGWCVKDFYQKKSH